MKIVRKEWVCELYTYELKLTDEYIDNLNKYLQDSCCEILPPISAEDIADSMDLEVGNIFLDKVYTWKNEYKSTLRMMINDLINNDIFDYDCGSEFIETEDFSVDVIR